MMGARFWGVVAAAAVVSVFVSCDKCGSGSDGPAKVDLSDGKQQTSYMLGRDIGKTIKELDSDLDMAVIFAAIREATDGLPSQLSDSATAEVDKQFRQHLTEKREQKRKQQAEDNKAAGEKFLASNKAVPGVVTTESGLQYQVISAGDGPQPKLEDRVKVHYHGTLLDGTVFDSSRDRGDPAQFPLTGVIRGWTEALQLMKVGSKYKIFVPSDLAYGERGAPRSPIGPNTALIFEIELLEIVKPEVIEKPKGTEKPKGK